MVAVDCLEDTFFAVYVAATGDVTILDFVEAYVAQELFVELFGGYFEVSVVHVGEEIGV